MARPVFPDDLVQAQQDWDRTYAALAAPRPRSATVLRRRLLRLSARLVCHPFWSTSAGRSPAARVELHQVARDREHREET
ncbi:hypothetical protein ACFQ6Q_33880 [Streptomyces sp. NPDC056437]|uniref:hypothetical protein n=1 Tax=Streptomyces sp. NPDC056437 TaxID=3345816 RepID=UPI00368D2BD6